VKNRIGYYSIGNNSINTFNPIKLDFIYTILREEGGNVNGFAHYILFTFSSLLFLHLSNEWTDCYSVSHVLYVSPVQSIFNVYECGE